MSDKPSLIPARELFRSMTHIAGICYSRAGAQHDQMAFKRVSYPAAGVEHRGVEPVVHKTRTPAKPATIWRASPLGGEKKYPLMTKARSTASITHGVRLGAANSYFNMGLALPLPPLPLRCQLENQH